MTKFLKFGVFALLGVTLSLGVPSCGDDDPDYSDVTPPTVSVTHSISGRVTSVSGEGLTATVSMGTETVTTQADGTFAFENVSAGTYTLRAEATGKIAKETTVTVSDGESNNPVWNVSLSNEGTTITVQADGSASGDVTSETLEGNDEAAIVTKVTAPAGAVETGEEIIITPIYSTSEVATSRSITGTRAEESTLLIGTSVSCSNPSAALQQPVSLEYDLDPEVAQTISAQKYVSGQWVDAEFSVADDGTVTVVADQFTSYTLSFVANITAAVTSETLTFTPNSWDNLYGSSAMSVASATYSYKIGTEISSAGTNKVTAYLIEILARAAGAGVTTAAGTYPINVTLPVGTAMNISGTQAVTTLTASALGRSVSGKQYGTVSVVTKTWNRQHTGGSGGNQGM